MSYNLDNRVARFPILSKYPFCIGLVKGGLQGEVLRTLSAHVTLWLMGGDACVRTPLLGFRDNGVCPILMDGSDSLPVAGPGLGPANTLLRQLGSEDRSIVRFLGFGSRSGCVLADSNSSS